MDIEGFSQWLNDIEPLPIVMGILNVTPDSFSDGSSYLKINDAYDHAQKLIIDGADIIDIGGQSSRPGAREVSLCEELDRVIPIIERVRSQSNILISIDTYKAAVMQEALKAGANIINDIKALREENSRKIAAQSNAIVCLMHMLGLPQTMQDNPKYTNDIVIEINNFFQNCIKDCINAGISKDNIILDPGFGFGKTDFHNLTIVKRINEFSVHGRPLLLGVSRKSTIGRILNKNISERIFGALAISVYGACHGVSIFRTHDVKETKDALKMTQIIKNIEDFKENNEYT